MLFYCEKAMCVDSHYYRKCYIGKLLINYKAGTTEFVNHQIKYFWKIQTVHGTAYLSWGRAGHLRAWTSCWHFWRWRLQESACTVTNFCPHHLVSNRSKHCHSDPLLVIQKEALFDKHCWEHLMGLLTMVITFCQETTHLFEEKQS